MERLSALDATFLYLETDAGHMHVAMVGIYDVSTMRDGYSFEKGKQHIAERLHVVPPFRRRLVEVPFKLDHPDRTARADIGHPRQIAAWRQP